MKLTACDWEALLASEHKDAIEQLMRARLGAALGTRKYPRIRAEKGVIRKHWVLIESRRTRRAALRRARWFRDCNPGTRHWPFRVLTELDSRCFWVAVPVWAFPKHVAALE